MFWNIGITRDNKAKLALLIGIMASAMLLPSFPISYSLPRIRLDEALIFGAFGLNFLYFLAKGARLEFLAAAQRLAGMRAINRTFLLFLAAIAVSNIYAAIALGTSFGLRDLMELVTLTKYYLVMTLVVSMNAEENYPSLKKAFLIIFGLIVIIAWGQFLNLANMNAWLTPLLAPSHLDNLVNANPPRVLGTFDNPNVFGIFTVIVIMFASSFYYVYHPSIKKSLVPLVIAGLAIKLAYMTISRTALVTTAIGLVVVSIWAMAKKKWKKEILLKVAILFLVTVALFVTSPRDLAARINEGLHLQTSTSAQGHLLRSADTLTAIKQSPIFGWGTAKTSMTTLVDDEYLLITRRYGIVGLLVYLWFFIKPCRIAWRNSKAQGSRAILGIAFSASTIAVLIYNITAGVLYNLQLMTIFAGLMGLMYGMESKKT